MKSLLTNLPPTLRVKLPFLLAGFFSFLFSVYLYFVMGEETAGIFVGLWVPSIHSLGTLIVSPVTTDVVERGRGHVMSLVIFGIGVLVFFITVYGTVVAGGIRLTARQIGQEPGLASDVKASPDGPSTRDVIQADF